MPPPFLPYVLIPNATIILKNCSSHRTCNSALNDAQQRHRLWDLINRRLTNVHLIPPTKAALEEYVRRAAYRGGHLFIYLFTRFIFTKNL